MSRMKHLNLKNISLALALAAWTIGCSHSSPPPEKISVGELPAAMQTAFAKAQPGPKALADQVVASVQGQDYTKAFQAVQALSARTDLTKDQVAILSRVTITVNSLLQEAQTKGDVQATKTLENYRRDK